MSGKKRKTRSGNEAKCSKKVRKNIEEIDADSFDQPMAESDLEVGEVGIIEKLTLKNFMCHSNFEISFGPHVNFIVGRNGTGKSAILNGLILAFGGKSVLTGKHLNASNFVQDGKHCAEIAVTIRNTGDNAYKFDEFGPEITIERRLVKEGSSSYKIRGNGKIVSTKHEVLAEILNRFNIQVDNPVAILTQDASKMFLESRDAKKKYSFFLKGTQLEALWLKTMEAKNKIGAAESALNFKLESLPEAEKELQKEESNIRILKNVQDQKNRLAELNKECFWALVQNNEKKMTEYKLTQTQFLKKIKKLENEANNISKNVDDCSDSIKAIQQEKSELKVEQIRLKSEEEILSGLVSQHSEKIRAIKHRASMLNQQAEDALSDIRGLEKIIDAATRRNEHCSGSHRNQRQTEMEKHKQHLSELQKQLDEINISIDSCNSEIDQLQNQQREIDFENLAYEKKIQQTQKNLETINVSKSKRELRFGPKIPELNAEINRQARLFSNKPIGPIGLYISVNEKKWEFAISQCLGTSLLRGYCCSNMQDRNQLLKIMKGIYGNAPVPNIFVSMFLPTVHDISHHRVQQSKHKAIIDAITCDSIVILNSLIDQVGIERILLIEDSQAATHLMMDSPPQNCSSAFTQTGDQVFPSPKYRYYSCMKKQTFNLLQQSYGEDMQSLESELKDLNLKKQQVVKVRNDVQESQKKSKNNLKKLEATQSKLTREIYLSEEAIKDLEVHNNPVDLTSQESEMERLKTWHEKLKGEIEERKKERLEACQDKEEAEKKHKDKFKEMELKKQKVNSVLASFQEKEDNRMNYQSQLKRLQNQLDVTRNTFESNEKGLQNLEMELRQSLEKATNLGERIDTDRSPIEIQSEFEELEKAIESQSGFVEDIEKVQRVYLEKKCTYENLKKDIERLKILITKIQESIMIRLKNFEIMRNDAASRLHYLFQTILDKNKFQGQLIFDHQKATLKLLAEARPSESSTLNKTVALSGGEKSFVTVALLLALYDVTEMPFHLLDEYDVFMDSFNRDASMSTMLATAREQGSRQFVFFTPLGLPAIEDRSAIQVCQMPEIIRSNKRAKTSAPTELNL